MRMPKFLAWTVSGLTLAGAGAVITNTATPANAEAVATALQLTPNTQFVSLGVPLVSAHVPGPGYSPLKWGIIGRNTFGGDPNAVLRAGPWGRSPLANPSANMPPPYGIGSLGIIIGSRPEKIAFGNETDFAGVPLSALNTLKYWIFTGADSMTGIIPPNLNMEVNPHLGAITYTSLVYLPHLSASPSAPAVRIPNIWQQYDATAAGNQWWATGPAGAASGCTQATPCSFSQLKAAMPNAAISFSLGFSKGPDSPFVGALDGLQINNTVYDFEPLGVFKTTP